MQDPWLDELMKNPDIRTQMRILFLMIRVAVVLSLFAGLILFLFLMAGFF